MAALEGPREPLGSRCACGARPVTFVRYSGAHLCGQCLCKSVELRARRETRKHGDLRSTTRVAVAVSGGKDSLAALTLLAAMAKHGPRFEMLAITVDEGIEGYRPAAVDAAARACRDLGIEHTTARLTRDALVTIDEVAASAPERAPCSFCGVLRRRTVNAEARRWGADYLATGHNLDDVAQSILMSFVRGDLVKLAQLAPHDDPKEGLVRRILPLRMVPEKEVFLYAMLKGLPFSDSQCPHMGRALRGQFKEILMALEDATPGTRHAIVRTHDRLRGALTEIANAEGRSPVAACPRCGEPSVEGVCQACLLLDEFTASRGAPPSVISGGTPPPA